MFQDTVFSQRFPYLFQQCSINSASTARFLATPCVQLQTFQHALSVIWTCCFHFSVSTQNMQVDEVERDPAVDLPQRISPSDKSGRVLLCKPSGGDLPVHDQICA
jgi:hypothetical protein